MIRFPHILLISTHKKQDVKTIRTEPSTCPLSNLNCCNCNPLMKTLLQNVLSGCFVSGKPIDRSYFNKQLKKIKLRLSSGVPCIP